MVALGTLITGVLNSTLSYSIPLVFASLGGIISERSGILYFGQEGIMAITASVAVITAYFLGDVWLGLLLAVAVGAILGLIICFFSINIEANQIMLGVALLLLGPPLGGYMVNVATHGGSLYSGYIAPIVLSFLRLSPLAYVGFVATPLVWFFLFRTNFGLKIRTIGDDPKVADVMGINVRRVQYYAVILGSALVAIGGAYLTIGITGTWQGNPVSGEGILAIAIVRISNWKPQWAFPTAILFGAAASIGYIMQAIAFQVAFQFFQALPYIMGLVAWAAASKIRRFQGPRALGQTYRRQ